MIFERIEQQKAYAMDALSLAFVGDAICALFEKNKLVLCHNTNVNKLHILAREKISGGSQAKQLRLIENILTEQEQDILKRARNAKINTVPKNLSLADYKLATAFEAIIGYNWVYGNYQRVKELLEHQIK